VKRWLCKLFGHDWSRWQPKHGRFRYRKRTCAGCGLIQMHDIQLNQILELPH
jgi:hypothetical protein